MPQGKSQRYSFVEHLARSVLFSRYTHQALLAMITGYTSYFDASGHPDRQAVLTVGGFVSTVEKWTRFDREWTAILKRYGVTAFRMTDFVAGWGEFAHFENNSRLRKAFTDELTACIKKNVNKAFRTSLHLEDYAAINTIFALEEFIGRPYALCGNACLYANWLWARKKKAVNKLLCYFEDGDKDKGDFEARAKATNVLAPLFLPKEKAIAFQAADFAAWKFRDNAEKAARTDHTLEKGKLLLASVKGLRTIPWQGGAGVLNYESLMSFCRAYKVRRR